MAHRHDYGLAPDLEGSRKSDSQADDVPATRDDMTAWCHLQDEGVVPRRRRSAIPVPLRRTGDGAAPVHAGSWPRPSSTAMRTASATLACRKRPSSTAMRASPGPHWRRLSGSRFGPLTRRPPARSFVTYDACVLFAGRRVPRSHHVEPPGSEWAFPGSRIRGATLGLGDGSQRPLAEHSRAVMGGGIGAEKAANARQSRADHRVSAEATAAERPGNHRRGGYAAIARRKRQAPRPIKATP